MCEAGDFVGSTSTSRFWIEGSFCFANDMWEDLFEEKLLGWSTNENWWPKERTEEMFWEWFNVEFHSMVIDPYEDPIKKERL